MFCVVATTIKGGISLADKHFFHFQMSCEMRIYMTFKLIVVKFAIRKGRISGVAHGCQIFQQFNNFATDPVQFK